MELCKFNAYRNARDKMFINYLMLDSSVPDLPCHDLIPCVFIFVALKDQIYTLLSTYICTDTCDTYLPYCLSRV